jgi:hypothetical protein
MSGQQPIRTPRSPADEMCGQGGGPDARLGEQGGHRIRGTVRVVPAEEAGLAVDLDTTKGHSRRPVPSFVQEHDLVVDAESLADLTRNLLAQLRRWT